MSVPIKRTAALALCAAWLQACGAGGPPEVASAYRERLAEAWDLAGRAENPTGACTMVVGVAVGRGSADASARSAAAAAYRACYVDVAARYLKALIDRSPGDGDAVCGQLATYSVIGRMSLGSFAADLGQVQADLDAQLADAVGTAVQSRCPGQAGTILGR